MKETDFTVNRPGYDITGRLHLPEGRPRGLVIDTHGLFADMTSVKHQAICRLMAAAGLAAARFDCLGCGQSGGDLAQTTLTGRAEEIETVYAGLSHRSDLAPALAGPVILIGSSFGGSASLLTASRVDWVTAVIAWAAPNDFKSLGDRERHDLEHPLADAFFDDLEQMDLLGRMAGLRRVLLVHGELDEVVPVGQAEAGLGVLPPPGRLFIVRGADHALTTPGALETALVESMSWLGRTLGLAIPAELRTPPLPYYGF